MRAFNISHEQIAYARARAKREGLGGRRSSTSRTTTATSPASYDAFVSVGMLEHVGVENYADARRRDARAASAAHGRGLIHSIGRNRPAPLHPWIEKRIFPGAYPPSLGEMMQIFEPWDLSVLDVENLRLHYAQTLRHWLELYEGASDRVREMFDEKFVRMWRLYLAGSVAGFTTGTLQLFQVVFAPRREQRRRLDARAPVRALRQLHAQPVTCSSSVAVLRARAPPGSSRPPAWTCWCSTGRRFPRLKLCAGWMTPEVVQDLEIDLGDLSAPLPDVRRACTCSSDGLRVPVRCVQHSIRRFEFDAWLLRALRCAGRAAQRAPHHPADGGGYMIDDEFRCRYLIGAGGTRCPVYRDAVPRAESARQRAADRDAGARDRIRLA